LIESGACDSTENKYFRIGKFDFEYLELKRGGFGYGLSKAAFKRSYMEYKRQLPGNSIEITTDWDSYPEVHNYQKKMKKLGKAGILKFGEVNFLNIAHDDWCDIYNRDRCNCNPTIVNALTKKVYEI
jgi:hypothetical protein